MPNGPERRQSIDCENNSCKDEDMEEVSERLNHMEEDDDGVRAERMVADGEIFEEWLQVRDSRVSGSYQMVRQKRFFRPI